MEKEGAELFLNRINTGCAIIYAIFIVSACNLIPNIPVWLSSVDFEVDANANDGQAFVCHIVIAYSQDLYTRLQGMDAQGYFSGAISLEKTYKDSIEVFKFDIIPGKNKTEQSIRLRSYLKSKGAFIFAKYLTPGKFMENVGNARKLTVRFLPHKMECHSDISIEDLTKKILNK